MDLHFSSREIRENEDVRLINSAFGPVRAFVDEDFDDMLHFGLHDEHDVRSIMDLPRHGLERFDG